MKAEYIIRLAKIYLTFRQVFQEMDVAVAGDRIIQVSPKILPTGGEQVIDGSGMYLIPGLIDIHMHVESSMTCPEEFSGYALKWGTTTAVADAHEMANVFGIEGIRAFMEQKTKMDLFWAIPSSVPATDPEFETSGGEIGEAEAEELLKDSRVLCLGEVMNFHSLTEEERDTKIKRLIRLCRERRGRSFRIEGHCPKLSGSDLNRFICAGVDADHTQQTPESVLEKTDLGMFLELQKKSLTPEVAETVVRHRLYENVALVTDDVMPDHLVNGQLNEILRTAVQAGIPAEQAVYCATYTPARRMHLDDRGMIAPGKKADFWLTDSLETWTPRMVFKDGRPVEAEEGRRDGKRAFPERFYHSVHCRKARPEDFILRWETDGEVTARVIRIQPFGTMTEQAERRLRVRNHRICWQEAGLCLAVIYERHGKNGNMAWGLVEGAFTKAGAAATTWSHDSHNLLVLGNSPEDMLLAQQRVVELQGGYVAASGGRILAEAALPVGGIVNDGPLNDLARALGQVRAAMKELGYVNNNEIMSMSTLALPVSPALKLTDTGLLETKTQKRVEIIKEQAE